MVQLLEKEADQEKQLYSRDNRSDSEKFALSKKGQYQFKDIPLDDPRVWALISFGKTCGIFQLEKQLGQDWARKVRPTNIEELAALISLLRPGPLESKISESYAKRKNGEEDIIYDHPSLEPILKNTYGLMIFQEQILRIGIEIAGMSETDADTYLRKGIGKKVPELIAKCKSIFLQGCKKNGIITEDIAEKVFGDIEKFQRYGFNKCLSLDTVVETKYEFKTIDKLSIGDLIKAPSDNYDKDEFIEVLDIIDNGNQELYELTLESGKTISCTINHEFLCEDREKHTVLDIITNNLKIICE